MKILIRGLIVWLVLLVVFWLLLLPYLMGMVTHKMQDDNTRICKDQLGNQGLMPQPVSDEEATTYCSCLSEVLQFGREDLFEIAKTHQLPVRLQPVMQAQSVKCQPLLENAIRPTPGHTTKRPDGSVEIQL